MLKEKLEQPGSQENAGEILRPDSGRGTPFRKEGINEAELSQEERDKLIEDAEDRLQGLMDRAYSTATMARRNKFIAKSGYSRIMRFLEKTAKEIAAADENSADINETLARLEALGNKLKLPGDIKTENIGMLLEKEDTKIFSKGGEIFLGTSDEDKPERRSARPAAQETGDIEHQTAPISVNVRHRNKTGGNFYLSRRRRNGNRRDDKRTSAEQHPNT